MELELAQHGKRSIRYYAKRTYIMVGSRGSSDIESRWVQKYSTVARSIFEIYRDKLDQYLKKKYFDIYTRN